MAKQRKQPTTTLTRSGKSEKVSAQIVAKNLEKQAQPLIKKISSIKIKTSEDYDNAFAMTKELKALAKEAQRQLDTIVDPIKNIKREADASIKAASAFFRPFQDLVVEVDQAIKIQMLDYQSKLDKKKLKLEEDFEEGKITKASTYLKKSGELEETQGVRMVWQAVPKNINKTPDKYWIVDEDKVKEDLKAGKDVPGWSWEQVKTISI